MSGDANPLLSIRGVAKRFNSVIALRSADLEVRPGEIHALTIIAVAPSEQ